MGESLIREQRIFEGWSASSALRKRANSFALVPGAKRPRFVSRPRQQRVLYYYFLDPQLGLIHVRLQTWAPFTCPGLRQRPRLARPANGRVLGLGFVQKHNAFTQLDDPAKAQRQADRFAQLDWPKILGRYARHGQSLAAQGIALRLPPFAGWSIRPSSPPISSSQSPAALTGLYQKLLQFAAVTFTPKDILGFLGRKWDRRFDGDVQTDVKTDRLLGTRIKHRMTPNWLKMYDKFGLILRVETVINRPREFSVYRTRQHRDGTTSTATFR